MSIWVGVIAVSKVKRPRSKVPLQLRPKASLTKSIVGDFRGIHSGTALTGFYHMDYRLPKGDLLRILFNHDKSSAQLLLLTHDAHKLRYLPGTRPASLVANTISQVNRYLIHSDRYSQPLTPWQIEKRLIAEDCITSLTALLEKERNVGCKGWDNWSAQEDLRIAVIAILERARDDNLLLANTLGISKGKLNDILYEARQAAQSYQFNRLHAVSRLDQLDFTEYKSTTESRKPCFVWDSSIHLGHYDEEALNDALFVICQQYELEAPAALSNLSANRFERLAVFLKNLWEDTKDYFEHLVIRNRPQDRRKTETDAAGLSLIEVKPYYELNGFPQRGYKTLEELMASYMEVEQVVIEHGDSQEVAEMRLVTADSHGCVKLNKQEKIIAHVKGHLTALHYFEENGLFYPLPSGQDLYDLSQLGKRHLYLIQRFILGFKAFFTRIPAFFKYIYDSLYEFVEQELYQEFMQHLLQGHPDSESEKNEQEKNEVVSTQQTKLLSSSNDLTTSLTQILHGHDLLGKGETLQAFVKRRIQESNYVLVKEEHSPSPIPYTNPLHRTVGIARHMASIFIDPSERNPIIGLLALAAYLYGGGAIIAPDKLTAILAKLHLNGLISGIQPTQTLAQWMSHGTLAEAVAAAMTYWQGVILVGDLDGFFIQAIDLLKEDPAEVAIIVTLATLTGDVLCHMLPFLQKEMGHFPYINYAFLGAKLGIGGYDIIMHPGEDWLLGTLKWSLRLAVIFSKICISPFIEGAYCGFHEGFIVGMGKSYHLLIHISKQLVAALLDLSLELLTIPLLEMSALFLHVPFRGVTELISRVIGALGSYWQPLGKVFVHYGSRSSCNDAKKGIRFFISQVDKIISAVMLIIGQSLVDAGQVWDNSGGYWLRLLANAITHGSSWIDARAGNVKQLLLKYIQLMRHTLYDWAFSEEESSLANNCKNDSHNEYFFTNIEKFPHDESQHSTNCFLKKLWQLQQSEEDAVSQNIPMPVFHRQLFEHKPPPVEKTEILSESIQSFNLL